MGPIELVTFIWDDGFRVDKHPGEGLMGMYAEHPERLRPARYAVKVRPGTLTPLAAAELNRWLQRDCESAIGCLRSARRAHKTA